MKFVRVYERNQMRNNQVIGKKVPRIDGYEKVTGKAKYVADLHISNMLFGKILRSPLAHAIIEDIDTSKAENYPGVMGVITYKDVPNIKFPLVGHPYPADDLPYDALILSQHVRYVGEPVAAVAAETPEIAEEALSLINVKYHELPFYLTPEESLNKEAIEIHEGSHNLAGESGYEIGDVDSAFSNADIIVEDEFITPIVTHSPIETHLSLVDIDHRGRLTFYVATQVPTILRERLAMCLGMSQGQIRIVNQTVGGGFGGKQEPVYEQINAMLTLKTRRPVYLELTREEELSTTRTRHSGKFYFKTGISSEGKLLAREMKVVQNTGAYSSHGHAVIQSILGQFSALYPTPNLRCNGKTVYTNILIAGAMRGYGLPQYTTAMEGHIDHIAHILNKDPLEYRTQVSLKKGERLPLPDMSNHTIGLAEALEKCRTAIGYDEFRLSDNQKSNFRNKQGIGTAICSYGSSCYPHSTELSSARVMVADASSATLFIGSTEIGQDSDTTMAMIAAETLGIPLDKILVVRGDTDVCPIDMGAYASRQTYVTGSAVKKAAKKCKDQILEKASTLYNQPLHKLDACNGNIILRDSGKIIAPMSDVTLKIIYDLMEPQTICYEESYFPTDNVLTFGVTMAIVNVNIDTGKVNVNKLVTCLDSGTIINPLAAYGQLYGGSIMSLGYGLSEQIVIDPKTGRILNDNMLDYKIPTFLDVPEMEGYFVETEEPTSAYGNKVLGEPPNLTPAAAIRNAVYDAIGVCIHENPLTPERVYFALHKNFKNTQNSHIRNTYVVDNDVEKQKENLNVLR